MTPTNTELDQKKHLLQELGITANQCRNWHRVCMGIQAQLDRLPLSSQKRLPLMRNLSNSEDVLARTIQKGQSQIKKVTLGDARTAGLATADGDFWWDSASPHTR
jgi:phage terminase Nu1 subunit (DNA packaging protein)